MKHLISSISLLVAAQVKLGHCFTALALSTATTANNHPSSQLVELLLKTAPPIVRLQLFQVSEVVPPDDDDDDDSSEKFDTTKSEKKEEPTTNPDLVVREEEEEEDIIIDPSLGAWVPIGSISSLEGLDPVSIAVFGTQLVVWKKKSGEWSVLLDECTHRLAPLSQGRVDPTTNCIECPYHGWQFDNHGTLTRLPQLEENKSLPTNANAKSFPVHVCGDLLFAFLPTRLHGESFLNDTTPDTYYPDLKELVSEQNQTFYSRDLPYSWDFLVENLLDGPAHLPFAHHSIGSKRDDAAPVPMQVQVSNFTHFAYQSSYIRQGEQRYRRFGFQRPFLAHQDTERGPNGEWKRTLLFFCVPIREGKSRVITNFDTVVRAKDPKASDWQVHLFNNKFFDSDIWVHETEISVRSKEGDPHQSIPNYLYPTSSDISVQGFRKWWAQFGYSKAPSHSFGPASMNNLKRLTRKEQIDPWKGHTKNCSKCRLILTKAKKYKRLSLFAGSISAIYMLNRSNPFLASALFAAGLLARERADKMIKALEGETSLSEVADRTFASSNDK
jgi:phenylpropionate dioxygenase-like ring-hydroxylating dioxygenase large terminal subunit